MSKGWISVHRSIFENELWKDTTPFDYRSAWIDLLLLANHEDRKVVDSGKLIEVKRGEVNRSVLSLSQRWHWSRNKTRNFFNILQKLEMVTVKGTTQGTTITIENYSKFQDLKPTESTTQGQREVQREVQREDINNNYNNYNNYNNNNYNPLKDSIGDKKNSSKSDNFVPPTPQDVKAYCIEKGYSVNAEMFCDHYASKGWMVGRNRMKDWKAAVRNWQRRDDEKLQPKEDRFTRAMKEIMNEQSN